MKRRIFSLLIAGAMVLCLFGCGGGSAKNSSEEESPENATINLETETGIMVYKDYEYVSKGFFSNSDGDATKTICLNFDYTNKEDSAKSYSSDFDI